MVQKTTLPTALLFCAAQSGEKPDSQFFSASNRSISGRMLNGYDDVDYLLSIRPEIDRFEAEKN